MTPTLYYYEHCPYCLRVLTLVDMAKITIQREILLNDDEQTPIEMIGQKMLPILQTAPKTYLPESLDIMRYLSETYDFPLVQNSEWEAQVTEFLSENRDAIYGLTMPRWIQQPFAEFATPTAIDYFVKKKTATIGDFAAALSNTDALTASLNNGLQAAEELFIRLQNQPQSYAAILLFAGLYGVRCVDGFAWTAAAQHFMQKMTEATGWASE